MVVKKTDLDGRDFPEQLIATGYPQHQPGSRSATNTTRLRAQIGALVEACGGDPRTEQGRLTAQIVSTALQSLNDQTRIGERKLMARALKEVRHAFQVFSAYPDTRKVSIFGSARTAPNHPDYAAAIEFSQQLSDLGWMAITGAGNGIMKAGHEGPSSARSFGLAIRLPFEASANDIISEDAKLMNFNYFFTRKLLFLSQSHAIAVFPGGLGTQDELLETLTLMQTGKTPITPVVLVAGTGSGYWISWRNFMERELVSRGLMDLTDLDLVYVAKSPTDAARHVQRFYANYHSQRSVDDEFILRMKNPLHPHDIREINEEFSFLVSRGRIRQSGALPAEDEFLELPRLRFHHSKRNYSAIRRLIDRINEPHLSAVGDCSRLTVTSAD